MRPIVQQMQQDRIAGLYYNSDAERDELLRMGAVNVMQPPLPLSPCVRIIATGEVLEWTEFFAMRPDLCENCNEYGDTDPSTWQGRGPDHASVSALQEPPAPEPIPEPELESVSEQQEVDPDVLSVGNTLFNLAEFSPDASSDFVQSDGAGVGLPEKYIKNFTVPETSSGSDLSVNRVRTDEPIDVQALMQGLFAEYAPK